MSHGANTAFVELSRHGSCSSGSVMVPCPWFPEAAAIAVENPALDLGVHLTLTSEQVPYRWRPLTAPPFAAGLTDELGYFFPDVPRARKADPAAVEKELRAQVDTALAARLDPKRYDAEVAAARAAGEPVFEVVFETPWGRKTDAETAYREIFAAIGPGLTFLSMHFNAPGDFEAVNPKDAWLRTEEHALFR